MEDPGDAVLAAHQSAAYPMRAGASVEMPTTLAADDDEERSGRLLLLGKGTASAHRRSCPLAADSDD